MNEKIRHDYYDTSGRFVFDRFFGRLEETGDHKLLSRFTDLYFLTLMNMAIFGHAYPLLPTPTSLYSYI